MHPPLLPAIPPSVDVTPLSRMPRTLNIASTNVQYSHPNLVNKPAHKEEYNKNRVEEPHPLLPPNATPTMLLSDLLASTDEVLLLSNTPSTSASAPVLSVFTSLLGRLKTVLVALDQSVAPETLAFGNAVDSLGAELRRTQALIRSSTAVGLIEVSVPHLGRGLGLLLSACTDAPVEIKEMIGGLHREMMAVRFEGWTDGKGRAVPDFGDVVLRIKGGAEEDEVGVALLELEFLVEEGFVGDEEESLIQVLLNRLGVVKNGNRLKIILVLSSLASRSDENKERMSSIGALSTIVRSLSRDVEERREAVGLLLNLSKIQKVRQRLGRVQGCIVMLVALLNGEDEGASCDAGKLLGALSGNTQNVLLMAEAGFFVPLVQYLKEGSDMNKILMATAISRMELTDQMKASLGEEGSVEPLVKMFTSGNLEAKMSALGALRNLSSLTENVCRLINAGIVAPLLQLLFSVTSVMMTLREPASAILASIAQAELILIHKNVAQQMLSLLTLSSPAIQLHLLQALNSIAGHSNALKVRAKMKENGAMQLLLPFLTDSNSEVKVAALNLFFNLSKDFKGDMTEQLGETHLSILVGIISTSKSDNEKAAAVGILSNIPVAYKQATEILLRANLLPILISLVEVYISTSSNPTRRWLLESIAGVLIRFTISWDKKLQRVAAAHGVIPCLLKLLSSGSCLAKSRAATSLAHLSQNSLALSETKSHRWFCVPPSETFCEVHRSFCTVKTTFCLVKAGAIPPLVQILEGKEREADEAVLNALASLMQDDIWENGSNAIEKASGVQAIIQVLEVGSLKAQVKAVWMLERIFRHGTHRGKYGEAAQVLLVDLAQNGDLTLKPMVAKILAHLQLLQMQSSYF